MLLDSIAKRIVRSKGYKFTVDNKNFLLIIEGLIIISLLVGVWVYFYQDSQIKKQINEKCGYTTNNWECVCEKSFVDFYKDDINNKLNISFNLSEKGDDKYVKLVR